MSEKRESKTENIEEQSVVIYEPVFGDDIMKTAEEMVNIAKDTKKVVKAKFNDIQLLATEDSTPEGIFEDFTKQIAEIYRKSLKKQSDGRENKE